MSFNRIIIIHTMSNMLFFLHYIYYNSYSDAVFKDTVPEKKLKQFILFYLYYLFFTVSMSSMSCAIK